MGLSCPCCWYKDIENIDQFNRKFVAERYNTKIELNTKKCRLNNIGQKGFSDFCFLNLKEITILNLSNNNIDDITVLKNFRGPKLEELDLSYNSIRDINIFQELKYPLKELDLRYNLIIDIKLFKDDNIFPKLTKLYLDNNFIDSKNEENENIMNHLKERMKKNMEKYIIKYENNDNNYKKRFKRIKTINDKFILPEENKINIFDKDKSKLKPIKTLKLKNGDVENNDTNSYNSFQTANQN